VTPEDVWQRRIDWYRRLPPWRRVQIGLEMYDEEQEVVCHRVRQDHPDWDAPQVAAEVFRIFWTEAGLPEELLPAKGGG